MPCYSLLQPPAGSGSTTGTMPLAGQGLGPGSGHAVPLMVPSCSESSPGHAGSTQDPRRIHAVSTQDPSTGATPRFSSRPETAAIHKLLQSMAPWNQRITVSGSTPSGPPHGTVSEPFYNCPLAEHSAPISPPVRSLGELSSIFSAYASLPGGSLVASPPSSSLLRDACHGCVLTHVDES